MKTDLKPKIDLKICQIIYVVIRSFFKYLVSNVRNPIFVISDYHKFFKFSLSFFTIKFGSYNNKFGDIYAILKSKMIRCEKEEMTFEIN